MQKINPYQQDRIYACILQIIWQCKKNFHKTIQGISKSLFFMFNYIWESSVDCFLWKQSDIFWKCINLTPLDCILVHFTVSFYHFFFFLKIFGFNLISLFVRYFGSILDLNNLYSHVIHPVNLRPHVCSFVQE